MKKKKTNKRTKDAIATEVAQANSKGLFHVLAFPNWITGYDYYNHRGEVRKTKGVK